MDTYQDLYCWWIFSHPAEEQYLHMFIFLPIPTGSPSIWACCVVQKGLPPTSMTDHQSPLSLLNSLCSAPQCLPEWWLAQEEVAWDGSSPVYGPQDHRGKDYLTPSFPSLRKKAHTHLWLISLPKQYSSAKTLDSFSGLVFFPKLSPCTPSGFSFAQRRYLLLHAQEQWQGQAVQRSPATEHAALWPPNRQSVTSPAKFSSKTSTDLYSLQLYKHGVNGSRALYLQHCTSLPFPCRCHFQKH